MSSSFYRLFRLVLVLCACLSAETRGTGQVSTLVPAQPEAAHLEQVARVPGVSTLLRGFNAGVSFSGVHDSSIGWYDVVTPAVSYTFSPHYSADASLSIYPYRLVENQDSTTASSQSLDVDLGDTGDTLIGVHAVFNTRVLRNTTTASFTVPTGDRAAGLGTGKVTFDFSDHMEHYVRQMGFLLDLGAGDSSGSVNNLVMKDYNSLGPLAHFQAGAAIWLPGRKCIQSVAYEQLPMGNQTVYTTIRSPGQPDLKVITGKGVSEDNGFTTSLGIPLTGHLALSGYYNRSLRQHLDSVSIDFTYVLRATPGRKRLSLIDKALRDAERFLP